MNKRIYLIGIALALYVGVLLIGESRGQQAGKEAVKDKVLKLAAAIKAGKNNDARKLTGDLARVDLEEVMKVQKDPAAAGNDQGYVVMAVAEVAALKGPPPARKNAVKAWDDFVNRSRELGLDLIQAQKKGAAAVKVVSTKLASNCQGCHDIFKQ